jgi:non-ribosomal peptide synthetase component F
MSLLQGTTGREQELPDDPISPQTLRDVFATARLAWPDRIAIEAPDAVLTYAGLGDRAGAVARRLAAAGVGPGDKVGVRIPSGTADLYVAILGVLLSGAAYVPVDADDPDERAASIWNDSGAVAVLGPESLLTMRTEPRDAGRAVEAGDDAWVIFTSGSTGRPKGVAVGHRAATAFVEAEARLLTVGPGDRVLAGLSVGFDASCEEI